MNSVARFLPWSVTALTALSLAVMALPPRTEEGKARLYDFGKLPVVDHGRVKPMDTLARTSLMVISGRQIFQDESEGPDHPKTEPAIKWLLDVMTRGERDPAATKKAWEQEVFRLEDGRLLQAFGLPERPSCLYSLKELGPNLKVLFELAVQMEAMEPERLNSSQKAILGLAKHIRLYGTLAGRQDKVFRITNDQILALLDLEPRSGFRYAAGEFVSKLGPLLQQNQRAREVDARQRTLFDHKVLELGEHLAMYVQLTQPENLYVIPPPASGEEWKELAQASGKNPVAQAWDSLLTAYEKDQPAEFNGAVAECAASLRNDSDSDMQRADFEVLFNHFAPFYQCAVLYVFVIVLASLGWLRNLAFLQRSAFWLGVLTLTVHTGALLARMYLSGRWFVFVTNLYSSAVFIGWMSVVLGLVLECIYHNGMGNMLAGLTGSASLIVAHHLGSDGDTLEMLQAVLDTNFWLATHVTCITIGYSATFVAGFLGWGYIGAGVLTSRLQKEQQKELSQMIYGIVCFAMLFSFTGTVLGGIWADQSWGRFWGWDPKENGAVLIVISNALIIHARWGGLVKERGLALLAVFGNMIVGWSWFGTNQLSVGLHNYGFSKSLAEMLVWGWGVHLAIILAGSMPLRYWKSYAEQAAAGKPRPPAPPFEHRKGKRQPQPV